MKNLKKLAAAVLAVTVSAAATGSIAYAKNSDKTDKTDSTAKTEGEKETSERESNGENAYKDETVYVMCNNDASVKNVVVSDWLKNPSALTSLSDISSLEDIVNVKGDEAFTVNGEDISSTTRATPIRSSLLTLISSTSLTARKLQPTASRERADTLLSAGHTRTTRR